MAAPPHLPSAAPAVLAMTMPATKPMAMSPVAALDLDRIVIKVLRNRDTWQRDSRAAAKHRNHQCQSEDRIFCHHFLVGSAVVLVVEAVAP